MISKSEETEDIKGFLHEGIWLPKKVLSKGAEWPLQLELAVLSSLRLSVKHSAKEIVRRAGNFREKYQEQLKLILNTYPELDRNILRLIYEGNCRPYGVSVTPRTNICRNAKVCPWCFVRYRTEPIYKSLTSVTEAERKDYQIVVWETGLIDIDGDYSTLFLKADAGPFTWLKAVSCIQVGLYRQVFPAAEIPDMPDKFKVVGLGFAVIPKTVDARAVFERKAPKVKVLINKMAITKENLMKHIVMGQLRYPFQLLRSKNVDTFYRLYKSSSKVRLFRKSQKKVAHSGSIDQ